MKKLLLLLIAIMTVSFAFADTPKMKEFDGEDVTLQWAIEGQNIRFILKGQTSGWVAIGISPTRAMKDANIIIGYVDDKGKVIISDEYGVGAFTHSPITSLGGKNKITLISGSDKFGETTLEFIIPLKAVDKYSKTIEPAKKYSVILATGQKDDLFSMHKFARKFEITF